MDVRDQAMEAIKKTDTEKLGNSILRKVSLFAWETGLSPVINALPDIFGQQAVLYFPGRSVKYTFPCYEHNGSLLLALTEKDLSVLRENLLQNPGVEIWLKNGWFAGTARLLTNEEKAAAAGSVPDEVFFGKASKAFGKRSVWDHYLLEVTRSAPCTGSSGPASKAWIWSLAAVLLLFSKRKK